MRGQERDRILLRPASSRSLPSEIFGLGRVRKGMNINEMLYELNEADVSEFDRLQDVDIANAISAGLTIAEALVPFQGWGGKISASRVSGRGPNQ